MTHKRTQSHPPLSCASLVSTFGDMCILGLSSGLAQHIIYKEDPVQHEVWKPDQANLQATSDR